MRDADLTRAFVDRLGPSPELIDLGSGSGSNLRYLAPHLPPDQRWTCIDHDPALLDILAESVPVDVAVDTLRNSISPLNLSDLSIKPGIGVTAAALLDLASADWLDRLAERCRDVPVLFTLSFDGRMTWTPEDPADQAIENAFRRHQRSDKGFGPAMGPDAAHHLADRLRRIGHEVRMARSDWEFGSGDRPILEQMVDGVAAAAGESIPTSRWIIGASGA